MNLALNRKTRSGNGRKLLRRKSSKRSAHEEWLRSLEKMFPVYHQANSEDSRQRMITYQTVMPPRMPSPGGPSKGAALTITQLVAQSGMTLPSGTAAVGSLVRAQTTDCFESYAFCLADVPNVASLAALFDQYRIEEIQLRFRSRSPGLFVANSASPNYSCPNLLAVVDRDDAAAATTILELQQYDNCQQISTQDSLDIILKPSITPSVFSGGAFSGYAVEESGEMWLDVANTSIPHYGVKIGITSLVATSTQKIDWDVYAVYKVSFLNLR